MGLGWVGWVGRGGRWPVLKVWTWLKSKMCWKRFFFCFFFGGTAVFGACMLIFQLRRLPLDWYENLLAFSCFIPIGPHNSGWLYLENEINVCFINCAHTYLSKQTTAGCVCVCTTDILVSCVSAMRRHTAGHYGHESEDLVVTCVWKHKHGE